MNGRTYTKSADGTFYTCQERLSGARCYVKNVGTKRMPIWATAEPAEPREPHFTVCPVASAMQTRDAAVTAHFYYFPPKGA